MSDGLVNGARGEIVHVVTNSNSEVTNVLVKFDNEQVGVKAYVNLVNIVQCTLMLCLCPKLR